MKKNRITFNLFINENKSDRITVLEGQSNVEEAGFTIDIADSMASLRSGLGIEDNTALWHETNRFEKRVELAEGESIIRFFRATREEEIYYVAVVKTAYGYRSQMMHKSRRNRKGETGKNTKIAQRFIPVDSVDCVFSNNKGVKKSSNGGFFYNSALQITITFFGSEKQQARVEKFVSEVKAEEKTEVQILREQNEWLQARLVVAEKLLAEAQAKLAAKEKTEAEKELDAFNAQLTEEINAEINEVKEETHYLDEATRNAIDALAMEMEEKEEAVEVKAEFVKAPEDVLTALMDNATNPEFLGNLYFGMQREKVTPEMVTKNLVSGSFTMFQNNLYVRAA
ncbi:hypothetical protein AHT88_17760 [Salmonella enterica subsp. enterica serovar Muenchen]|nr:hypothetical protein [Salmonella enterica subsp. enterica serovar Muenchen]